MESEKLFEILISVIKVSEHRKSLESFVKSCTEYCMSFKNAYFRQQNIYGYVKKFKKNLLIKILANSCKKFQEFYNKRERLLNNNVANKNKNIYFLKLHSL